MLKFGNTFVNYGGTYFTGFKKSEYVPVDEYGWAEIFNMSSNDQVDTQVPGTNNEYIYNYNNNFYQPKCTIYDNTHNFEKFSANPLHFDFHVPNVDDMTYMLMSFQEVKHVKLSNIPERAWSAQTIDDYCLPILEQLSLSFSINDVSVSSCKDDEWASRDQFKQILYNDTSRVDLTSTYISSYFDSNYRRDDKYNIKLIDKNTDNRVNYLPVNYSILLKNNGDSYTMSAYTDKTSNYNTSINYDLMRLGSASYNNKLTSESNIQINFTSAGQTNLGDFGWLYHSYFIPKLSVSALYGELNTTKLDELLTYTVSRS